MNGSILVWRLENHVRATSEGSVMRRKARLEEMFTWEIATAMAEVPLCYLPVGTLEWHGEHAAVGLDALKAHAVCIRAADRSGGLVAPLYWSIAHNIAAIRETGEVFRREHPKSGWLLLSDQEVVPDLHNPVEHAAGGETSLILAIHPNHPCHHHLQRA